jgi:hypothetical protein
MNMTLLDQLHARLNSPDVSSGAFLLECLASSERVILDYTDWPCIADMMHPALFEIATTFYRRGDARVPQPLTKLIRKLPEELIALLNAFRVIRVYEQDAKRVAAMIAEPSARHAI